MASAFEHRALELQDKKPIVFTALSKKYFYLRMLIVKFVLEAGCVPLNPFMAFDYFLADAVDRDVVRNANNVLVDTAAELWTFGSISNGVFAEIKLAKTKGKTVRHFACVNDRTFKEIGPDQLEFEDGVEAFKNEL